MIEDHFDTNPEQDRALREAGKDDMADMVRNSVPDERRCILLRRPALRMRQKELRDFER